MKPRWMGGGFGVVMMVALLTSGAFRGSAQQQPPPLKPPPATLEERVLKLEARIADQELEIEHLAKIAGGLMVGAAKLADAADQSRVLGFEEAGPNPAARTELLEGLRAFNSAVKTSIEPPPPAPENGKK